MRDDVADGEARSACRTVRSKARSGRMPGGPGRPLRGSRSRPKRRRNRTTEWVRPSQRPSRRRRLQPRIPRNARRGRRRRTTTCQQHLQAASSRSTNVRKLGPRRRQRHRDSVIGSPPSRARGRNATDADYRTGWRCTAERHAHLRVSCRGSRCTEGPDHRRTIPNAVPTGAGVRRGAAGEAWRASTAHSKRLRTTAPFTTGSYLQSACNVAGAGRALVGGGRHARRAGGAAAHRAVPISRIRASVAREADLQVRAFVGLNRPPARYGRATPGAASALLRPSRSGSTSRPGDRFVQRVRSTSASTQSIRFSPTLRLRRAAVFAARWLSTLGSWPRGPRCG